MENIKIMIVEDDLDWIKALTRFINHEQDMVVIATATDRREAVKLGGDLAVEIILMDINLEGNKYEGIYTAAEIGRINPAKIIMLTSLDEPETVIQSFTAGAINYVTKQNYRDIPGVIRAALNPLNPVELLVKDYHRLKEQEALAVLSPSEREIYQLMEEGQSNAQIEQKLHKTNSTLKNQINSILKKLGANNRKEAVKKIKARGLYEK